jgi:MSHA pilin protein MshA
MNRSGAAAESISRSRSILINRESNMKKSQGFTLIELIAVIAILAILAATAIPQFVDLRADAQSAATQGIAGALGSASALNYAKSVSPSGGGTAVANCTAVAALLQGGLDARYTITAAPVAAGASVTCTLNGPSTTTATFTAIGV